MKSIVLFLLFAISSFLLQGQIFVKQDATGLTDGSSWENAFTNLKVAIDSAKAGDEIWIAAGIYKPGQPNDPPDSSSYVIDKNIHLFGGFNGNETLIEERDLENNQTILSGDLNGDDVPLVFDLHRDDNVMHLLYINDTTSNEVIVLDGLVIEGGNIRTDPIPDGTTDFGPWRGGGIYTANQHIIRNCLFRYNLQAMRTFNDGNTKDILLENCIVEFNQYSIAGGMRIGGFNQVTIKDCIFRNNISTGFAGGLLLGNCNARIENSTFSENVASESSAGGGLFLFQNSSNQVSNPLIEIYNCSFTNNLANTGGAIQYNHFFNNLTLVIDSCEFIGNGPTVTGFNYGGALAIQNFASSENEEKIEVNISNTDFFLNNAGEGGAITFINYADTFKFNIQDVEFLSNTADLFSGGGFEMLNVGFMSGKFENCKFDGNISLGEGGENGGSGLAMLNFSEDAILTYEISNCEFSNNASSGVGGAILFGGVDSDKTNMFGLVKDCNFIANSAAFCCGGIFSAFDSTRVIGSTFTENITEGLSNPSLSGGGAFGKFGGKPTLLDQCTFINNQSKSDGAAIALQKDSDTLSNINLTRISNSLFSNNITSSIIYTSDSLELINNTFTDNEFGLKANQNAYVSMQNNIFINSSSPELIDNSKIESWGSNISSNSELSEWLIGYDSYHDFNDMVPDLEANFVPSSISPCLDAGNPNGVTALYDLDGDNRVQGEGIDIGAQESPFSVDVEDISYNSSLIEIYPNPTINTLNVLFLNDQSNEGIIHIYDSNGKKVLESNMRFITGQFEWRQDISTLPPAVYHVLIRIGNKGFSKRFVKQ